MVRGNKPIEQKSSGDNVYGNHRMDWDNGRKTKKLKDPLANS